MTQAAGVILAGGRSSRMGVSRKALLPLNGKPLLAHVIARLQPQLGSVLISSESETTDFDVFGLPVVADLLPRQRGPLMGLYSVMRYLNNTMTGRDELNEGLLLCPCDAPFIPPNLLSVMLESDHTGEKPVLVISYQGILQPTFSLWYGHHYAAVHDAVMRQGFGGLKQVLTALPHTVVEWPAQEPPPFYNVNTPDEMEAAAAWVD